MLLSWLKELQRNNLDEDSIINLKELRGVFKNVSKETFSNSSFFTFMCASFSVSQAASNQDFPEPVNT